MVRTESPQPHFEDLVSAREAFFRDRVLGADVVPVVRESWLRSDALGVDPRSVRKQALIPEKLDAAREGARMLLRAAKRPVQLLHRALRDTPHMVVLSDASATIVRLLAPRDAIDADRSSNLFEGASWAESDIGTNGVGTAIASDQPVLIAGPQHFADAYLSWTCIGIPLRAPDGTVAGALDLSLRGAAEPHWWNVTLSVAESIEAEVARTWPLRTLDADRLGMNDDPLEAVRSLRHLLAGGVGPLVDEDIAEKIGARLDGLEGHLRGMAAALSGSHARLSEWDRRKNHALARLAHELKNPLNVIAMLNQLMERANADPSVIDDITVRLRRQIGRLKRTIEDIEDAGQVEPGALVMQEQDVDVNRLLQLATEALVPLAQARRQRISVRPAPVPLVVRGDAHRIEQIFTNVLGNALKYTQGGGSITAEIEAVVDHAVIRIRDDGYGIASEHLRTIFDEFSRVVPTPDDPGGKGLGLALVADLVRRHRGTVSARSDGPGKGSEFEIRLPLSGV